MARKHSFPCIFAAKISSNTSASSPSLAAARRMPRKSFCSGCFIRKFLSWSWIGDRKSTRLNSSHDQISYAVFCLKKKKKKQVSSIKTQDPAEHDHQYIPTTTDRTR